MEAIEQRYSAFSGSKPVIDPIAERYSKRTKQTPTAPREPAIYSKGGIYEQFGPNPPVFEPGPRSMAGFIQTGAEQPGSALPFIGQAAGGYAGPVGGVTGALVGEGVRQGAGRLMGVQKGADSGKQFKRAGENAIFGEVLGYGTGKAIQKGSEMLGPGAKNAAVRIAKNIIRPTGRLAKRSDVLAKAALEEGVLSSSPQGMISKIKEKSGALQDEIDSIIDNFQGGSVNAEGAFRRMDALERKYRQLGAFQDADKVSQVKNQIIEGGNFRQPVFGEKETGQFVMGPASKQTVPKITTVKGSKINQNIEPSYDPERGEYARQIVTPKKFSETPDDIVAMDVPGIGAKTRKIVSVSPEEKFGIRPETKGVSKKETVQIGTKPKEMTLAEANKRKREEYRYLEGKRAGGGWTADTSTPEIATRQEFAGGVKREIARKLPEVDRLNKRFGNLIDLGKATEGRANVGTRNDIMSLGDIVLAGNPKSWPLLIAKKAWQGSKGAAAKGLFGLPSVGSKTGGAIKSPAVRALLSNLHDYSNN